MYSINKQDFGYMLTFGGFIEQDEMKNWVADSEIELSNSPSSFGVVVDMRELSPLPSEAQQEMQKGQILFKQKGMQRSAVVLANSIIAMQFKRIGKETGIYDFERYIDASSNSNWKDIAVNWVAKGIDPDQ